jgi:tyrosine aminotransferase
MQAFSMSELTFLFQNGDATVGGNLPPCTAAMEALVHAALCKPHAAGYANACGTPEARFAIAKYHSYREHEIRPDNVIVANGCSGALELALTSLLDPGTTLLVPQPGFPLYQVIAESHGANVVHYRLDPDRNWECDMDHLEEIMARHPNVRAMVTNNPSSPTGSVFSERHIVQILEFARKHRLPIVADEVYGDLTFGPNQFHPMAQMAARLGKQVPIITASGISKQFLLPGWRVGWLTFHDKCVSLFTRCLPPTPF